MKYVTGIYALNINCELETCGDWHTSALKWDNPWTLESNESIFGEYGIEFNKKIPEHEERYAVANHIRAILDHMQYRDIDWLIGMRRDFIVVDDYDEEIFKLVLKLMNNVDKERADKIHKLMYMEYGTAWGNFKAERI